MSKILIVSNRLPNQITIEEDKISTKPSVGGLATGMKSVYKSSEGEWIGWPGFNNEDVTPEQKTEIEKLLKYDNCIPVYLDQQDMDEYYDGFSNSTIWPLFHYFAQYTEYNQEFWEAYKSVNHKFADVILKNLEGVDKVWVHDYHLMLLPKIIKEKRPDISIGFFLHIPFPSYEIFRILPWREELLEGVLGADLIGFHTYDYQRHFTSSVRRLLGYDVQMNQINLGDRIATVDVFPMGIDFEKFSKASENSIMKAVHDKSEIRQELEKYQLLEPGRKLILSIDRLDYSKGIPNRLHAFERFLEKYPKYIGKVTLILLAVPSRVKVEHYQEMKSEIDELVGRINGKYSKVNWTPIWYFYRSFPFDNLIELYSSSAIALITPVRDGMNLVAKEYIATRTDNKGVLILSEMAGATKELGEALIINPNNFEQIADSIFEALNMPEEEQIERNIMLKERLRRYNVERWANDFLKALIETASNREKYLAKKLNDNLIQSIKKDYDKAQKRVVFLDYDGTLVGFKKNPKQASPEKEVYDILDKLAADPKNQVVLISGRDKEVFTEWFDQRDYTLITEHGVWIRKPGGDWEIIEQMDNDWKSFIRPVMELYVDRTPGSFIEEKNYSLVWHYRKADHELGAMRALEIKDELTSMIANLSLEIMEGSKVIEIKNSGVNKGRAAEKLLLNSNEQFDFILGAGDDWTDEYLFERLPESAVTIKVGIVNTQAKYKVDNFKAVRSFLKTLTE
ncbi:bifunctional alpha,alpha-trehalose-phosphate synthase (UDP-forming)/trehalose-phosphatase [Saccharicrinis sp. FJH54]|uniref:bifunctional alpha,alpha-trehalose-phosphate synthase (UDP-forming)/trehalose-phosphatase n=1 Tax=Saccharicrinis sp. FJH54 TaxID=3344665 RepID=UPI0035D44324